MCAVTALYVDEPSEATVENPIAAVGNDPELPDVDRTRGPAKGGYIFIREEKTGLHVVFWSAERNR